MYKRQIQDLSPKSTGQINTLRSPIPEKEDLEMEAKIIKHELIDDEEENTDSLLIPTTDFIKNIDVIHEEVEAKPIEDDFVIINTNDIIHQIEVNDADEVKPEVDQFSLSFDIPVDEYKKEEYSPSDTSAISDEEEQPIVFDLSDDVLDIEVSDPIEVVPSGKNQESEVLRYSLEDYMEEEKRLSDAQPEVKEEDKEILLEKKTVAKPIVETEVSEIQESVDPVDQPISEILKARAAERRAKMKEFNYKFKNSASNIDEIEKEPAYKRAGIDVDSKPQDSGLSRTSLGTDTNDEIQLRKNNSFLHDNVD